MSKWIDGLPNEDGLFWFDPGFPRLEKERFNPLVANRRRGYTEITGNGGGGPISMVYHPDSGQKPRYRVIERPKTWIEYNAIPKENLYRCWIRHPKGYMGVGSFVESHGLYGWIEWLNHPSEAGGSGRLIRSGEGWMYSPLEVPKKI